MTRPLGRAGPVLRWLGGRRTIWKSCMTDQDRHDGRQVSTGTKGNPSNQTRSLSANIARRFRSRRFRRLARLRERPIGDRREAGISRHHASRRVSSNGQGPFA